MEGTCERAVVDLRAWFWPRFSSPEHWHQRLSGYSVVRRDADSVVSTLGAIAFSVSARVDLHRTLCNTSVKSHSRHSSRLWNRNVFNVTLILACIIVKPAESDRVLPGLQIDDGGLNIQAAYTVTVSARRNLLFGQPEQAAFDR